MTVTSDVNSYSKKEIQEDQIVLAWWLVAGAAIQLLQLFGGKILGQILGSRGQGQNTIAAQKVT